MRSSARIPDRIHARFTTLIVALLAAGLSLGFAESAQAATPTVPLGSAESFAVLAATGVSNVPLSAIVGDVGATPATGASLTGLTCEEVDGTIYSVDGSGPACRVTDADLLTTAKTDQTAAYLNAFGRVPDTTFVDGDNQLGNQTLTPGVYRFGSAPTANLVGSLTLHGDASSVWIFQATSDLVTAGSSTVTLTGGAQPCNIFWQVGSSATLGSSSSFVGTVLAQTSIFVRNQATIDGRLLAGTGAVTLDMNTVTESRCSTTPAPPGDQPPPAPPGDQPPPPPVAPPGDQPPPPPVAPPGDQPPPVVPPGDQPPAETPPTDTPQITTQRQVTDVPRGPVSAGGGINGGETSQAQHLLVGALALPGAAITALLIARRRRDA